MSEAGIGRISVSLDFPDAAAHDRFRGCPGAFDAALQGIRHAQDAGIEIQINSTITRLNVALLPRLLALAEELGAVSFHPFMLVPTGRGKELADQELDPDDYEATLNWIYDAQRTSPLFFKPTDVPHYWRVMRQRARAEGATLEVHPHSHGGLNTLSRGCLAGVGFCFISHVGRVQPCGYFDKAAGDVRRQPFAEIWHTAPAVRRPARPRRAQGQMRRLRVQAGLRRLPGARLRAHRRLPRRGALLLLRAAGLGAGRRLSGLGPAECQATVRRRRRAVNRICASVTALPSPGSEVPLELQRLIDQAVLAIQGGGAVVAEHGRDLGLATAGGFEASQRFGDERVADPLPWAAAVTMSSSMQPQRPPWNRPGRMK